MTAQFEETALSYRPSGPLDPVAAQIAEMFSANLFSASPVEDTRAAIRAATVVTGEPALERVEDHAVPVKSGEIALRFYVPTAEPRAIIVWSHGGGFALGSLDELDNFARLLAKSSGCAVASVEYRLAPEHPFPTAVEDVEAAALWVSTRRKELAGSDVPLVLGGDSAGGNLSTVVTRRLHTSGAARIAGNVLAYPCTDSPDAASLMQFDPPFMPVEDVRFFLGLYLPGDDAKRDPDFAPLYAEGLDSLPPTLILTAEHDILTGQAEQYGQMLEAHGVPTRISRYGGMIHGFLTLDPFFPGAAGEAIGEIGEFVGGLEG